MLKASRVASAAAVLIILAAGSARPAVSIDLNGGFSFTSACQYFDLQNNAFTNWLEFQNIHFACGTLRAGVNIFNSNFTFGVYGGFNKKFDLYAASRTSASSQDISRTNMGMVLSFPIMGYVENDIGPVFYEAGCGIFFTRMNFSDTNLPEFANTSIFGFLFGAGYSLDLGGGFHIIAQAELLVSSPGTFFDLLPDALTNRYRDSRNSTVYAWSDPLVMYNFNLSVGVRYTFADSVRLFY